MIPTDWLDHRARTRPDAIAVRDGEGRQLSYAELRARAAPIASVLRAPGRPCVIELAPGLDHAIAVNAALLAAVPFQTLRPGLPAAEREAALAGWEEHLRIGPEPLDAVARPEEGGEEAASDGPGFDTTLCRILTSGTSGTRKPVELSWGNHFSSAAASAFNLGVRDDDRWLCCMPVDHIGGLSILIRSLIYGTCAVIHPGFDVARVTSELAADVTIISLVPTQLRRLLDAGAPLDRPRLILLGGGPAPDALLEEALAIGAKVVQTYGLTEACSQVCTLSVADAKRGRGSAGRPLPGMEVEISAGEILVRGPAVAAGSIGADGWLHTGDRGRFGEDGFLRVEGRIDDLIVSGGENVAPEEVEVALLAHPRVAEAAVVGRPDPEWGSAVVAFVVAADPADPPEAVELIEHCRRSLAAHKLPKAVEILPELPRSASGKLLRRRLR